MLVDTLEKIQVLHDMGADPTEIIGLSDTGNFLIVIVKQPYAATRIYNSDKRPQGRFTSYMKRTAPRSLLDLG